MTNTNLSSNYVWNIRSDPNGMLWVMTRGNGINLLNPFKIRFGTIKHQKNVKNTISNNYIRCLYEDYNGVIWIGTLGTLDRYDPKTNTFSSLKHDQNDKYSLPDNKFVDKIISDPLNDDILWITLYGFGSGLCKLNLKTMQFTSYTNTVTDRHHEICPSAKGYFWIGSEWKMRYCKI